MSRSSRKRKRTQHIGSNAEEIAIEDIFGGTSALPTFVDRISEDRRRVFQEEIRINPPSPMKRQPRRGPAQTSTESPFSLEENLYSLDLDWGDEAPTVSDAVLAAGPSGAVTPSDPVLHEWVNLHREEFLRLLFWHEGRGEGVEDTCHACGIAGSAPEYRCGDCMDERLVCGACCLASHTRLPFHKILRWNGIYFRKTSLKSLGLRIQLGHRHPSAFCARRLPAHEEFLVLHENGVHEVAVDFCGCERHEEPYKQLLHAGWFPATTHQPKTCATFVCLDRFHALSMQAKTTAYDFYAVLEHLTDGAGGKPPNRYRAFLRMAREYNHLLLLKRRGRFGFDGKRASETAVGELAVRCPSCPRPDVNLPTNWANVSPEDACLYVMFIALDACFSLKRRMVSSERRDPALGSGWAYMVESRPYREYLLTMTDQNEMSTCTGLAALEYANTKYSKGYSATGVGMGVCARHEFVLPTSVGDLQKGERYANMDYIFASLLRHIHRLLRMIVSYDIVCQWWKELRERLMQLPPLVRLELVLAFVRFVVPKLHIHGHTLVCQLKYSLNLVPGSGQTDAEGIERAWAMVRGLAGSTRAMGPGSRSDTLDVYWSFMNWVKLLGLPTLLRRRLDLAKEEVAKHQEAFELFSSEQAHLVDGWRRMVEDFERNGSKKNPYESEMKGLTEAQVRLKLEEEEEEEGKKQTRSPIHEISPLEFVLLGLAVEGQQRQVKMRVALKKATTAQKTTIRSLRKKLNKDIHRLRGLQATYTPTALVRLQALALPEEILPENLPLLLPSSLASTIEGGLDSEANGLLLELLSIERRLREAQCRTALVQLRNQLHIKARLLLYKKNHSRHQAMNTRSRAVVARNEGFVRLHSEKYQMAWAALLLIVGGVESDVPFVKLQKSDIRCMEEQETFSKRELEKQRREQRQREREERLGREGELPLFVERTGNVDEEEEEAEEDGERYTEGQNRTVMSWIWRGTGSTGTDEEIIAAVRIEWCKAWARVRRWQEEVRILEEEVRRLPISLQYEQNLWKSRAQAVPVGSIDEEEAEGMVAYSLKQAAMYGDLIQKAEVARTEGKLGRGYRRRAYVADTGFASELSHQAEGDDEDAAQPESDEDRGDLDSDEEHLLGGDLDD
ncbi:hypothetical protein C8F01DRAFT_1255058 [Mycena amicta]|nr:hypothetical protein C8F01DRAFT_1255058 [Mycena amicta]